MEELHAQLVEIMKEMPEYEFEHIYIDNASTDQTVSILRRLAAEDPRIKVILNTRNFGFNRSSYYGILQASGDAVIFMVSDLQDPPFLIKKFIQQWEEGKKVVIGIKTQSEESKIIYNMRTMYYRLLCKLSDVPLIEHFTGFGLYDREVVEVLRKIKDPNPYLRGLITEMGFDIGKIEFQQPVRKNGRSKANFLVLFDLAMLGFTNNTKIPLRMATIVGFVIAVLSFIVGLFYLIYKIIYWDTLVQNRFSG